MQTQAFLLVRELFVLGDTASPLSWSSGDVVFFAEGLWIKAPARGSGQTRRRQNDRHVSASEAYYINSAEHNPDYRAGILH